LSKNDDKKNDKKKTEASQFKWAKQNNTPCVGLQMATSASLID